MRPLETLLSLPWSAELARELMDHYGFSQMRLARHFGVSRCKVQYALNPEKVLERNRKYRQKNPEKALEINRRYRQKNPEKALEIDRRYRQKKPEKSLERNRKYRQRKNKEQAFVDLLHVQQQLNEKLMKDVVKSLAEIPTPELRQRLAESLALTAEKLVEVASIVQELERRGEDLSGLRIAMIRYLRFIAAKTLLPEVYVRYCGKPKLMNNLARLSLYDQQSIIADPNVPVLVISKFCQETKTMDVMSLPDRCLDQIFAEGKIRSEDEQLVYLSAKPKKKSAVTSAKRFRVLADHENQGIKAGNMILSKGEVLHALTELAGNPEPIDTKKPHELHNLTIKVTEDELRRIKALVRETGFDQSDLLRSWMRALGVI